MAKASVAPPQAAAAAAPAEAAPKKSRKKLFIIIAAVLVVGAGGAAAMLLTRGKAPAAKEAAKEVTKASALYLAMDPPFVVNFQTEQAVRYLQVTVQLMTRDPETLEFLKSHDPIVRNDLLLLFGSQTFGSITTVAGKEALRAQALETVRKSVTAEAGKPDKVEAVYFTSFVIQ